MKVGLSVAAAIAAAVALVLLVAFRPASEVDRLEDLFTATVCPDVSTRETHDLNRLGNGPRFARYLGRTEPELTVIACDYSGPAVRYFEFANHDEVLGAAEAYRDDRRLCLLDHALFDVVGAARGHLPDFCDEFDGQLR